MGFIVPKHKQTSVARNRLKRRLREIVRLRLLAELPPVDLVVRARPEAYEATYDALEGELTRGSSKLAGVFARKGDG